MNTASCRSAITFIDGDKGILRYRGYPIEQLAEKATFLEVAWLLRHGELPTQDRVRRAGCTTSRTTRTCTRTSRRSSKGSATTRTRCRCSAAPSRRSRRSIRRRRTSTTRSERYISIIRLLAKLPTLAAFCYRHVEGTAVRLSRQRPVATARTSSRWSRGCRSRSTRRIRSFVKAIEVLFILHADHEQNCSTNAVRAVGSSQVDPFSAPSRRGSRRCTARCTAAPTSRCCA